ncbi:hypothetical protein G9A89_022667 [Geosiphon pyriformis]|nr:hypothetical protein G9A89_022667 [Geosiphon pyriformis]
MTNVSNSPSIKFEGICPPNQGNSCWAEENKPDEKVAAPFESTSFRNVTVSKIIQAATPPPPPPLPQSPRKGIERPRRAIKPVARLETEYDGSRMRFLKEIKVYKGPGICLGNIESFNARLAHYRVNDELCRAFHKLLFDRIGYNKDVKKHIRAFSGFIIKTPHDGVIARNNIAKWTLAELRELLKMFDIKTSGDKEELVDRLYEFLKKPYDVTKARRTKEDREERMKQKKYLPIPAKPLVIPIPEKFENVRRAPRHTTAREIFYKEQRNVFRHMKGNKKATRKDIEEQMSVVFESLNPVARRELETRVEHENQSIDAQWKRYMDAVAEASKDDPINSKKKRGFKKKEEPLPEDHKSSFYVDVDEEGNSSQLKNKYMCEEAPAIIIQERSESNFQGSNSKGEVVEPIVLQAISSMDEIVESIPQKSRPIGEVVDFAFQENTGVGEVVESAPPKVGRAIKVVTESATQRSKSGRKVVKSKIQKREIVQSNFRESTSTGTVFESSFQIQGTISSGNEAPPILQEGTFTNMVDESAFQGKVFSTKKFQSLLEGSISSGKIIGDDSTRKVVECAFQ